MISATSLNSGSSPHSLGKPAQIPLALENGRLRADSQKFLVPSLPVSARALTNDSSTKRRERSILNGTAHPTENHHPPTSNHINGHLRSYSGSQLHQSSSPRKDGMYPEDSHHVLGIPSNPSNFSIRSSVPIPCSSPSRASSASPSKSHSPSPTALSNGAGGPYTPSGMSELGLGGSAAAAAVAAAAAASRLYPGGFHGLSPSHASAAAHLSPYYAAAAAAAASHSLPYSLFGAHSFNGHSGNGYLDSFHHSSLLSGVPPSMRSSHSPSRGPQGYLQQPGSQSGHSPHLPHPTSTTSLHNQIIESAGASERYSSHSHASHLSNPAHHLATIHNSNNNSRFMNGGPGVTKGVKGHMMVSMSAGAYTNSLHASPKMVHSGMGGGDNQGPKSIPPSLDLRGSLLQQHQSNQHVKMNTKSWLEVPSSKSMSSISGTDLSKEMDHHHPHHYDSDKSSHHKEAFSQQANSNRYILATRSPDKNPMKGGPKLGNYYPPHLLPPSAEHNHASSGVLVDSNAKLNYQDHNSNFSAFPPPSPKKRSGHWNFPLQNCKNDLPSPSLPSSNSHTPNDSYKYLSNAPNKNPSSSPLTYNSPGSVGSNSSGSSLSIHSPKSPFVMTPPSASKTAQQALHFQFPSLKSQNDNSATAYSIHSPKLNPTTSHVSFSAPSTPNFLSPNPATPTPIPSKSRSGSSKTQVNPPPLPVEQLPVIDAFHRGSLTQLPNGDLKPVEDLNIQDFLSAANLLSDSVTIINCTVISIQLDNHNSVCKVLLTMGSQNQQVIIEASAEQPFFVIGRGWSSSAPARTEKKLHLPCTPLCVGDVCITLRRNVPPVPVMTVVNGNHKNSRGSASSRGGSHSGPGKCGREAGPKGTRTNSTSGRGRRGSASSAKNANTTMKVMPPPPNPLPPPPPPQPAQAQGNSQLTALPSARVQGPSSSNVGEKSGPPAETTDDSEGPGSPKKRRWSAPDAINDENNGEEKCKT